ncbi:C-3 sterol dehydrogenase/C-4 decarboxylase [Massariosphaeria phaeospora]|uniref:C-3 sterol dehydrogenase/C-4 decarboxylase n=1 Tax=Massariosphaeria phaeospora TaxID=100035 RepID=A0A7C8M6D4_9PLEO|nr:C-3 sterol dehydrogenase/C-4 decarboxylase [Massariosphaeria phaeospora]
MASVDALGSVLVLGGCGFLGHHIIQKLLDADDVSQITALDLNVDSYQRKGARYIVGNITSREDIMKVLEEAKPRVIFHAISPQALGGTRKLFNEVNVEGTRTLLKCIQEVGFVKALVYTSSSSVIHDNRGDLAGVTEDLPLLFLPQQTEYYSHTKALAEEMILKANDSGGSGLRTCAIRPAGMFGEGDRTTTGNTIGAAKEGKNKIQIGDNTKLFDWTYVGNNADAQLLAARALLRSHAARGPQPADRKVDGEAFVITNDEPWPFWDFTRAVGAAAGYPIKKEDVYVIPAGVMWVLVAITECLYWCFTLGTKQPRFTRMKIKYMTIHRYFDISKAKTRLGYKPRVSMEDGIERTAKWYLNISREEKERSEAFRKLV